MSSASASVTVTSKASIVSPCAYSLFPGSVITGGRFFDAGSVSESSVSDSGSGTCSAAVTVIVKSRVTSSFTPSFAVTVAV